MHHDNNHLDPVYLVIDSLKLKRRAHQKFIRCGEGGRGGGIASAQTTHWLLFIFLPLTRVILRVFFWTASRIDVPQCRDRWPLGGGSNSASYLTFSQAGVTAPDTIYSRASPIDNPSQVLATAYNKYVCFRLVFLFRHKWSVAGALWRRQPAVKVRHHHKLIWKPLEQQIHGSGLMKPALVATAWTQSSVKGPSIVPHHCIVHMGGAVMDMIGGCSLRHLKMNNGTVSST